MVRFVPSLFLCIRYTVLISVVYLLFAFFGACKKSSTVDALNKSPDKGIRSITVKPGQFVPIDRTEFNQNLRTGVFFVYPDNRDSVYSELLMRDKQSGILVPLLADTSGEGLFEGNIVVRFAEYYIDEINPRPKPDIYSLRALKTEVWKMEIPDTLKSQTPGTITKLFLKEVINKVRPSSCYKNEISYDNIRSTIRLIDSSVKVHMKSINIKQSENSIIIKMNHIRFADHFIAFTVLGEELHKIKPSAAEDSVRSKLREMDEWSVTPIVMTLKGAGRISRELTIYRKDCLE